MSDTQAIVAICAIGFVSLTAFVVVTAYAWRSNVEIVRGWAAWWRSMPARYRLWRDPVLRERFELIARYEGALELVLAVKAQRTLMSRASAAGDRVHERHIGAADEAYMLAKREAAERIGGFGRAEIETIAAHIAEKWFDGRVDPADVATFLEEEQRIVAANPHAAAGHMARIISRFGAQAAPAD